jgi:diadenosine tetraphosphate (Ap4A) HIT family hydrolase
LSNHTDPNIDPACPFCEKAPQAIAENDLAVAVSDAFPVSPGHMLVIPRRHFVRLEEATPEEGIAILSLVREVTSLIKSDPTPDGFNIGVNDGIAAGQTVPHLHFHVIPRYSGDMADPRGGIRWIFPERARYWESP